MHDDYWALREDGYDVSVPVADLSDEGGGRGRRRGSRARMTALVLVVSVLAAGVVVGAHAVNDTDHARRNVAPTDDGSARTDVLSALSSTTASGSFKIKFILTAAPGPTISGEGVVNIHPFAMVTTAQVPNLGEITTRVDGARVWEDGGANYGMTPSSTNGPGAPLSQFASLVMGSLGRREGAVAMNGMASPTGRLDLAQESITASSKLEDAVVDGVPVHVYEVTADAMKSLERPGLTPEQVKTIEAALDVLRAEGYTTTTLRLSIDGFGFIRQVHSVVHFRDGGTVTGDTTFSDFGCASVVLLENGPSIVADPNGCETGPEP